MDIKEIKEFLETNKDSKEVKEFIDGLKVKPTLDEFKNLLNTDKDYKAYMDSEKDKHSSKSLETWKTNNLEKLLDAEIKKRFPETDAKDLELQKMKQEIENMKKETLRKDLINKALKVAQEKKLPTELVDFFISDSEENTNKNLSKLEEVFNDRLETVVQERLKGNSYTPPSGSTTTNDYESLLKNADHMTSEQIAEMFSKIK